ncbi:MAG: serine/threonine protein kinase [Euzebyales bacterium]|nr:serine/threonine protein kinase [Euzebyales bacterium]
MAGTVAGLRYAEVAFDAAGTAEQPAADDLAGELAGSGVSDLFVFSHGWNNDRPFARGMYERFFTLTAGVLRDRGVEAGKVGTVGVFWPSMRWADEDVPGARGGAAAAGAPASDAELVASLHSVFDDPAQHAALNDLATLLATRPADQAALEEFGARMRDLAAAETGDTAPEDDGETALVTDPPADVFERFASAVPARREGGAAGLGDSFGRLWNGAKEALRQLTYWQMKRRAGTVGQHGLGPLLGRLAEGSPRLRVHLVGHSFGARLVSYSLAGLPEAALVDGSPIGSLSLLQGAFSHFTFADALPHDPARAGGLAGKAQRVAGPIVVSHTLRDTAVGKFYPLASLAGRQDAAGADDALYRWGAIGHDGAQAVGATEAGLGPVGTAYDFSPGRFLNLDGNRIIATGGPPSGAHSDIFHPEVAWAVVAAAGLTGGQR